MGPLLKRMLDIQRNSIVYRGKGAYNTRFQRGVKHMSDLLTVSEVAEILRVDGTTVRRWVKQGALEAVILPHMNERQAYRIKRETVNKILKEAVQQ